MSKSAWISAGKVSAAIAAIALLLGVFFQGQAQQRSDMTDIRAELRNGFTEVNGRFAQMNDRFSQIDDRFAEINQRLDNMSRDLATVRERVARIEGHLALPPDINSQAHATPGIEG